MREEQQHLTMQIEEVGNTLDSRDNKGRLLVDMCEQVSGHEQMLMERLKEEVDEQLRTYRRTLIGMVKIENPKLAFIDVEQGILSPMEYETRSVEITKEYLSKRMQISSFIERRAAKQEVSA